MSKLHHLLHSVLTKQHSSPWIVYCNLQLGWFPTVSKRQSKQHTPLFSFYHSSEKFVCFFPALSLRLFDRWMLARLPAPHSKSFMSERLFQRKQCWKWVVPRLPTKAGHRTYLAASAGTHMQHTHLKRAVLTAHTLISCVGHTQYGSSPCHAWSISPCHDSLLTDAIVKAPPYRQGITTDPVNSTGMLVPVTTLLRPTASPDPQS